MAVCRSFCRMIKTALFALVVCFTTINAFAACSGGYWCNCGEAVKCPKGSYSVDSSYNNTICKECQNGTTTTTDAQSSCNAICPNSANAASWEKADFTGLCFQGGGVNTNTLEDECIIRSCVSGYSLDSNNNVCVPSNEISSDEFKIKFSSSSNYAKVYIKINAYGKINVSGDNNNEGCTYHTNFVECNAGTTVTFKGVATGYPTDGKPAVTICYGKNCYTGNNPKGYAEIVSGKIGNVFPTLGTGLGKQPVFKNMFSQWPLKEIPDDLFGNRIYGPVVPSMFEGTFKDSRGDSASNRVEIYSEVPGNIFQHVSGNAEKAFSYTFANNKFLSYVSDGLFDTINASAPYAFDGTFYSCSSLERVPYNLFIGLVNKQVQPYMFRSTFANTGFQQFATNSSGFSFYVSGNSNANNAFDSTFAGAKLSNLPANTFASLSGSAVAPYMFYKTFKDDGYLVIRDGFKFYVSGNANADYAFSSTFENAFGYGYVPAGDMFVNLAGSNVAPSMFYQTFKDSRVSQLGSSDVPFKFYVSGTADRMFYSTFENCTNLTHLDENLFSTISGSPKEYMFAYTFANDTNLSFSDLPVNFFGNISGDQAMWMANRTFYNCSRVHNTLKPFFADVTVPTVNGKRVFAYDPFYSMFEGTGIYGQIPANIFGNLSGEVDGNEDCGCENCEEGECEYSYDSILGNAFKGTNLTGYVPAEMFENVTYKTFGNGESISEAKSSFLRNAFDSTKMDTVCPAYTYKVVTGYEDYWGNNTDGENIVACKMCPDGKMSVSGQNNSVSDCFDMQVDNYFTITTTNLSANTKFKFMISALGSYKIDWGDGTNSVLSTNAEDVEDHDNSYIEHTYTTSGVYNIKIYGNTIAYSNEEEKPAISFSGWDGANAYQYIKEISGSIGSVFPTLGSLPSYLSSSDFETRPGFYRMCYECSNLTTIDSNLFSNVTSAINSMFEETFAGCPKLETIPANLFASISGTPVEETFTDTFENSKITYFKYPDNSTVSFIPPTFFGNIDVSNYKTDHSTGSVSSWVAYDMFEDTDVLTQCPSGYEEYFTGFEDEYAPKVSCIRSANCASDKMHYNGTCVDPDFTLTTTATDTSGDSNLTDEFAFYITASGTWYVDWGDGTVEKINRENISDSYSDGGEDNARYYHKYASPGVYTIKMKGLATDYSGDDEIAAINFSSAGYEDYIASISGSLGKMFPTIDGTSPSFKEVFNDAENLVGELPSDLFSEVTTCRDYMFQGAFTNSEITKIPSGLFSSITDGCQSMFEETFENCDELTTVEQNAFPKTQYCSDEMYAYTFHFCSKLTTVPSDLFENQRGGCSSMFAYTFGNTGLTSIPNDLFADIDSTGSNMFDHTFANTKITSVPRNMFPHISWTDDDLFNGMFSGCKELTSIPANLFSGFDNDTPSKNAFYRMFYGDNNLQYFEYENGTKVSYIPSTFFGGLENSGYAGGDNVATGMFGDHTTSNSGTISNDTKILETCPAGTTVFNSKFKTEYAPKVSCVPISSYTVQYNINYSGGTNPADATYTVDGSGITLPTVTRTGYTLDGWYTESTGGTKINSPYTPTGNITLYAHWTLSSCPENAHIEGSECVCNEGYSGSPCSPITYNIRYEGMEDATFGTNHPTTATYDTLFTVDNPTKTGYKFTGWSTYLLPGTAPESVAYNVNGGTDGVSITAVPGEEATFIYYVENLIQFKNLRKTNSSTVKLTAKWTKQCGTGYDVINNNCVCNAPKIEENGVCHDVCPTGYSYKSITEPAVLPTIEATNSRYKSLAYPSGGSSSNVEDMSNGYYNVVWESGNTKGTLVGTASCTGTTGETRHETVVPENSFEEAENSGSNCWCKPVSWTPYGGDSQELSSDWVFFQEDGNACARECSAMCNNFFGTSHYINQRNDFFDNVKIISEDCVPDTYTVAYNINYSSGINPESAKYTVGGNAITLPAPTRDGYTFDGWYTASNGGTKVTSPYTPTGNITLYAHWTEISCTNTQYFDENSNSCIECPPEYPTSVNNKCSISKSCPALTCPEHSTCHYVGETTWTEYIDEPTTKHCQIEVDSCDSGYTRNVLNLSTIIGYNQGNGGAWKSNDGTDIGDNAELYGITNNGEFIVDFGDRGKLHGYSQCSTQSGLSAWDVENLSEVTMRTSLIDDTGIHCYCKLDAYTSGSTNNMQGLYAKWLYAQKTGVPTDCAHICSSSCMEIFNRGAGYIIDSLEIEDMLSICVPNTYTVTYEINYSGGTNPESASYTVGESGITLPTVTREGYTLDGWYTESNGGTKVTSPYTPTGDITLYAHWGQNNINLLYKYNDINNTETTDMCVYDGSLFMVPRPNMSTINRPGYRFMGWKYNKNIQ